MLSYLATAHTVGSGTLIVRSGSGDNFGTPPFAVTLAPASNIRRNHFINPTLNSLFTVTAVSGDTFTVTSLNDKDFAVGDHVILGTSIRGTDVVASQPVYTNDRFENPDFIVSLAAAKITDLPEGSIPGTNALALGEDAFATGLNSVAGGLQSFAEGNGCFATCDQCHAEGFSTLAGYVPIACTISGTTITIADMDATSIFYSGWHLILTSLTGGTGATAAIADIVDVTFDNPDTIITLTESVTDHTAGKANMQDYTSGTHAEGAFTIASGSSSHAEGVSGVASGNYSHAEGQNTLASGTASHAEGHRSIASMTGQYAAGSGRFAVDGDAQHSRVVAFIETTDATPTNVAINGTDRITLRVDITVAFTVHLVARRTTNGTIGGYFVRSGLIANNGGTVALIGAVGTVGTDVNASALAVAITADNTNDALQIQVTGLAATTFHWVARIELVEVG